VHSLAQLVSLYDVKLVYVSPEELRWVAQTPPLLLLLLLLLLLVSSSHSDTLSCGLGLIHPGCRRKSSKLSRKSGSSRPSTRL
jgi:hypothetical protein